MVGDPLDVSACLDQPVDVLVEADAVVVGVEYVIGLISLAPMSEYGDGFGGEINR